MRLLLHLPPGYSAAEAEGWTACVCSASWVFWMDFPRQAGLRAGRAGSAGQRPATTTISLMALLLHQTRVVEAVVA